MNIFPHFRSQSFSLFPCWFWQVFGIAMVNYFCREGKLNSLTAAIGDLEKSAVIGF